MYSYPSNIPEAVKEYSDGIQKWYIAKYNEVIEKSGDKEGADKEAWAEVNRHYYYDEKKKTHIPIAFKEPLKNFYNNISECPKDIQGLPDATMKRVWMVQYNNAVDEGLNLIEAKNTAWKAVKKFVFYSTPTCTWRYIVRKKNNFAMALEKANEYKLLENNERSMTIQKSKGEVKMENGTVDFCEEFKCHIPLQKNEQGMYLFTIEKGDGDKKKKEYFLKGEASNTKIDRQSDRVHSGFIQKMLKSAMGLTVFSEHKHDTEHTLGYVCAVDGNDEAFIPTTHLEDPEENSLVRSIVAKSKHGTKLYYSIHGGLTKIATTITEAGQEVQELIDGYIDEVSITAWPAGQVAPLSFSQSLAKSLDGMEKTMKKELPVVEEKQISIEKLIKAIETIQDDTTYSLFSSTLSETMWSFKKLVGRIMSNSTLSAEDKKAKIDALKGEMDIIIKNQLVKLFEFINNNPNETVWY